MRRDTDKEKKKDITIKQTKNTKGVNGGRE